MRREATAGPSHPAMSRHNVSISLNIGGAYKKKTTYLNRTEEINSEINRAGGENKGALS